MLLTDVGEAHSDGEYHAITPYLSRLQILPRPSLRVKLALEDLANIFQSRSLCRIDDYKAQRLANGGNGKARLTPAAAT